MDDRQPRLACPRRCPTYVYMQPALNFSELFCLHTVSDVPLAGYPPMHINAVLTHSLHFLGLLTFYLGIKLPFEVEWVGPGGALGDGHSKLGVGVPWIGAVRGAETGSWAR
jgi:hypothetical protein